MKELECLLVDEEATVDIGHKLAIALKSIVDDNEPRGLVVYLHGDLGAGKTTLTRGFVRAMGHQGNVKSPTYTLVEPYELSPWRVFHFDLYRLSDPEELEYMGIRDYFNQGCCCFIEWPEKGAGLLAKEDFSINMAYQGEQRIITFLAQSTFAEQLLIALNALVNK
ncbi:tRNA (adenosine(37)-N6)-threonylcarbamoyltransferase complex ATPase subunit type 1 TsaE [Colwellia sp. RSH04]|uniref:tRNA (adenosine(37)-N6)-threonylcarbamoyltransferase complex ATPase subunit type 1 TsaE n=1 Tax=Colwellia sp. RSH04 TaxID=2305464 RepID=UPI000E58E4A1|nr:tRNA (adenosine(37)-N6)-threonylcarbamoyltransferase complex ATPase subunit type 1 TsaE [Colwellia sp. RSH04]RHW75697.1 tRNA (adenosine(37)-N6)-threonylcarbamoyltransferase complex ATPase subunit type 1 TsaE [Colwellia sp. RSH04]